jgi:hypothetical protein
MDSTLKEIVKRQIPCLVGGAMTGAFLAHYFEFLFSFIVNTAVWIGISILLNKFYFKSDGLNDEKYVINYARSRIVLYINKVKV